MLLLFCVSLRNKAVTEEYYFSLCHSHISVAVGLILPNLVPATQDRVVRILVRSKTK